MRVGFSGVPFDPGRLLFGGAAGLEAVARCLDLEVRGVPRFR